MDRIDLYILKHMAPPFFAALVGTLALLMLERMLRLIELVGESNGAIAFVFDLLATLIPHYLGMAVPAALFIACFVGYRRLAQTSEIAAFASLGRGLGRLAVPALVAALALTAVSAFVHSHLQPHGRYAYRTLKFVLANASIAQALEAGAFVQFGDVTFMAEPAAPGARGLGRVFVHERRADGGARTITSTAAALIESADGVQSAINFQDGLMVDEPASGDRAVITFSHFDWPVDRGALGALRPRGGSARELTWPELLAARNGPPSELMEDAVNAEIHVRAARTLTVLLIPFLAIPLAVAGGRTRSAAPLAVGVIVLLIYVQALQFAETLAYLGRLPAGPTVWSIYGLFALGVGALFLRAWRGVGFDPGIRLPQAPRIRLRRGKAAA